MKEKGGNKFFLFFLLLLFFVLGASFVLAQEKELEVGQYPIVPGAEAPTSARAFLPDYAKYVLNFALSLVGLFIFGVLVYGGFLYLTSTGNPIKLETAKKQILAAFLGLIIILCSYLILHTINPQLVIFQIPEWIKVELSPFIKPLPPLEEQTLYAKEIPTGKLIDGEGKFDQEKKVYLYEGVLAETRLSKIKNILEELKEVVEDLKDEAKKLTSLASQCACSLTSPQCTGMCSGAVCVGDPCPVRDQINKKRGEIQKILDGAGDLKGLKDWQKILDEELNGQKGLKQALKDLIEAEQKMKQCPSSFSERGKTQSLLNAANFEAYKSGLKQLEIVKDVETQPIWGNIYTGDDDFTFYCSEIPFEVSLKEGEISEEAVEESIPKIETAESTKVFCEMEIPVGEAIDDAESLTKKLIAELENVNKNVLKEIEATQKLISLTDPENCVASNCNADCIWIEQWCSEPCPEEAPPGGGDEDWWNLFFIKPPFIYAQGDCGYDCSYCEVLPCSGSLCPGDPPKMSQINNQFSEIQSNVSEINSSYETIKLVTEKGELEEELTVKMVSGKLNNVRIKLGDPIRGCLNTTGDWTSALFGEKILGKQILSCEDAKNVCWDFKEDYQCYGEGDPEAYPNYFCGEVESP